LRTVREFLEALPDGKLLEGLRAARGRGRDDYPVRVLWGVVVLSIVLRHEHIRGCLGELRRNAGLRRLLGMEREEEVPNEWNVSRFMDVLGQEPHRSTLREMFQEMAAHLGKAVPDLGRQTAGDATGLSARGKENKAAVRKETAEGLPQPTGGRKEYCDERGEVVRAVEWFGYKLHLLVDVKHEVALAYLVTSTQAGDGETLPKLLGEALKVLPRGRIQTLAYDKAADTEGVHKALAAEKIKPLIEMRSLWKEEQERLLPGHDGRTNIVFDEAGTVYCYDKQSDPPVRQRMAYIGREPARGTLKYRCPARHGGWRCASEGRCNAGRKYGLTVRVKQEVDLRRFPPIPRATKQFERLYKGRTAVERLNARLKVFWGLDDGNVTGARRFHALVGTVLVVHLGLATLLARAPRWEGTLSRTRLGPIQKALSRPLRI
jgi:hypothetical protein